MPPGQLDRKASGEPAQRPTDPALPNLALEVKSAGRPGPLDVDVEVLKPDELVAQGKTLLYTPCAPPWMTHTQAQSVER